MLKLRTALQTPAGGTWVLHGGPLTNEAGVDGVGEGVGLGVVVGVCVGAGVGVLVVPPPEPGVGVELGPELGLDPGLALLLESDVPPLPGELLFPADESVWVLVPSEPPVWTPSWLFPLGSVPGVSPATVELGVPRNTT